MKVYILGFAALLTLALWSDSKIDAMDTNPNNLTTNYWIE